MCLIWSELSDAGRDLDTTYIVSEVIDNKPSQSDDPRKPHPRIRWVIGNGELIP